jgi:hypothetical protein
MIRRSYLALALCLGLAPLAVPTAGAQDKKAGKTVDLFAGPSFDAWDFFLDPRDKGKTPIGDVWSIREGVVVCKGRPFGYVLTKKEHGDYKLELEWRWNPDEKVKGRRNSGVFVHVSGPNRIWPKGAEAQLMEGNAGDFWLVDNFKLDVDKARQDKKISRHYFRMKTKGEVEKPLGQWNKYEITCEGNTITLKINGHLVNVGKNAEASKGRILLQSEGAEIHFRNVRLTPLK